MAWAYSSPLTYDHTKCGSSDSTNITLCITVTDAKLATVANSGYVNNVDGSGRPCDLVLSSDSAGTTLLSWEVESYDATAGTLVVWVLISTLSHTSDGTIYISVGDASVSTYQGGTTGAAWDTNSVAVYHLGSSLTADSSANGYNLTNSGSSTVGQLDGAAAFSAASSEKASANGPQAAIGGSTAATLSAWLYRSSTANDVGVGFTNTNNNSNPFYRFGFGSGGTTIYVTVENGFNASYPNCAFSGTGWHHFVLAYSAGTISFYIDGALQSLTSGGVSPANPLASSTDLQNLNIAWDSGTNTYRTMSADEVKLASVTRSADWITAEYNNQSSPSPGGTFWSALSWTAGGGGGPTLVTGSDTISLSVSESQTSRLQSTRSDTASLSISESQTSHLTSNRSDTASLNVSESQTSHLSSSRSDTASLSVGESRNLAASLTVSDTASLSATEGASGLAAASTRSDSLSLSTSESQTSALSSTISDGISITISSGQQSDLSSGVSDSIITAINESGFATLLKPSSDAVSISISETSNVTTLEARVPAILFAQRPTASPGTTGQSVSASPKTTGQTVTASIDQAQDITTLGS